MNLRPPAPEAGALPNCATPRQSHYNLTKRGCKVTEKNIHQRGLVIIKNMIKNKDFIDKCINI